MKIIYITPYPPSEDGIAQYSAEMVNAVKSIGKEHTDIAVYSFKRHGVAEPNQYALMSTNPFSWPKIYHDIRQKRPDIIHLQFDISNFMFGIVPLYFLMLLLKHRSSAKIAATYHEAYRDKQLYGIFSVIFYRVFSRLFDRIYVHSEVSKQCLIDVYHLPSEKIKCIALGTQEFTSKKKNHAELRKRYNLDSKKVVLSFGYIYRTKGLEYLVDAVALLKKQGHELPAVIIAGQVPKRNGFLRIFQYRNEAYLKRIKQQIDSYKLNSVFHFTGYVANEELFSLFTLADVVVLPYVSIDQSAVLNTAISAHTPVIASDIGGMSEILRSSGVLVKTRNSTAIKNNIALLLSDKKIRSRIVESYKLLAKELDIKNVAKQLLEDYDALAQSGVPEVFQVTANYVPYLGGLEKAVYNLSTTLARRGRPVTVLTSTIGNTPEYQDKQIDGYKVERMSGIEIQHVPIIWKLPLRLMKVPRNAVLQIHIAQAFLPEITLLIARLKGAKIIAQVHLDVAPSGRFGFIFILYKKTLFPWMLRNVDKVVVFTENQRSDLHNKYRVELAKLHVIPNGVESRFYYDKPRVLHQKPRLLFVGRLNVQKNLPQLLKALDGISDQFETNIVGDGELRGKLTKQSKELKLQNVTFNGRKDGTPLLKLYQDSDVFVLPSEREGMPLVALEAMAMALPIVANDVTGSKDVVRNNENGLLVPLNDAEAFRSALVRIKSDERLYEKMSKASSRMTEQYSWDKVASQFERLYEDVSRV